MIIAKTESTHLLNSNKEKCKQLISFSKLGDNDIIDTLISLHLVLEVGLNHFYRHLSLLSIKKDISHQEVIKNIDNISFIDKTVLFIYNSKFNFDSPEKLIKAAECHKIINRLRDFAGVRNKLLHGHSISTIYYGEGRKERSSLKEKINLKFLNQQIKTFRLIMEGLRFYLDCLESSLTEQGKKDFKESFLDDSFIPSARLDSE